MMAHKTIPTGVIRVECNKDRWEVRVTHENTYPGVDLAQKIWKAHKRAAMRAWERETGIPALRASVVNAICSADESTTIYEIL